jgi:hypothetical protein
MEVYVTIAKQYIDVIEWNALRQPAVGILVPNATAVANAEETRFCIECSKSIPARAKFCAACGKPQ